MAKDQETPVTRREYDEAWEKVEDRRRGPAGLIQHALGFQVPLQGAIWALSVAFGGAIAGGRAMTVAVLGGLAAATDRLVMKPARDLRRRFATSPTRSQDELVWEVDRVRERVERPQTRTPWRRLRATVAVLGLMRRLDDAGRSGDPEAASAATELKPHAFELLQQTAARGLAQRTVLRAHLELQFRSLRRDPNKRQAARTLSQLTALADGFSGSLEREIDSPHATLPLRTRLFGGVRRWRGPGRFRRFMRGDRTRLRRVRRLNRLVRTTAEAASYLADSHSLPTRPLAERGIDWSRKHTAAAYADVALTATALGHQLGDRRVSASQYREVTARLRRSYGFTSQDFGSALRSRHEERTRSLGLEGDSTVDLTYRDPERARRVLEAAAAARAERTQFEVTEHTEIER